MRYFPPCFSIDVQLLLKLISGKISSVFVKDLDPSLKAAHPSMKEEGIPRIIVQRIDYLQRRTPNLPSSKIKELLRVCQKYEIDEIFHEIAHKHIPSLDEKEKHELLRWSRANIIDDVAQRLIGKLAVQDRILKLKYIVASEGRQFDGSYPFAVCEHPEIQKFLRGAETTFCFELRNCGCNSYCCSYCESYKYFNWKVRCTCQFHLDHTRRCELDPAFSVEIEADESQFILTKTADHFLLQQRLMEQRKEELAALLLLTGPTKRALPSSLHPQKRKCA